MKRLTMILGIMILLLVSSVSAIECNSNLTAWDAQTCEITGDLTLDPGVIDLTSEYKWINMRNNSALRGYGTTINHTRVGLYISTPENFYENITVEGITTNGYTSGLTITGVSDSTIKDVTMIAQGQQNLGVTAIGGGGSLLYFNGDWTKSANNNELLNNHFEITTDMYPEYPVSVTAIVVAHKGITMTGNTFIAPDAAAQPRSLSSWSGNSGSTITNNTFHGAIDFGGWTSDDLTYWQGNTFESDTTYCIDLQTGYQLFSNNTYTGRYTYELMLDAWNGNVILDQDQLINIDWEGTQDQLFSIVGDSVGNGFEAEPVTRVSFQHWTADNSAVFNLSGITFYDDAVYYDASSQLPVTNITWTIITFNNINVEGEYLDPAPYQIVGQDCAETLCFDSTETSCYANNDNKLACAVSGYGNKTITSYEIPLEEELAAASTDFQDYELRYVQGFDLKYNPPAGIQYDDEPYGIAADEDSIYYGFANNTGYWLQGLFEFDKLGDYEGNLILGEIINETLGHNYEVADLAYYEGKYYVSFWNNFEPYKGFLRVYNEEFNILHEMNFSEVPNLANGYNAQVSVENNIIYVSEYISNEIHQWDVNTYEYLGYVQLEQVMPHLYDYHPSYINYTSDFCVIEDKIINIWGLTSELGVSDLETGEYLGEVHIPTDIDNASNYIFKGLGCYEKAIYVALSVNNDYDNLEGKRIHQYVYVPMFESSSSGSNTNYVVDASGNIKGIASGNNYIPLQQEKKWEAPTLNLFGEKGERFDFKEEWSNFWNKVKGWFIN